LCNQVHADIPTVLRLRQEALSRPSCCVDHGHPCTTTGYPADVDVTCNGITVPLNRLAPTVGLRDHMLSQGTVHVTVKLSDICRLHHSGPICRFGSECRFIHCCKELHQQMQAMRAQDLMQTPIPMPDVNASLFTPTTTRLLPAVLSPQEEGFESDGVSEDRSVGRCYRYNPYSNSSTPTSKALLANLPQRIMTGGYSLGATQSASCTCSGHAMSPVKFCAFRGVEGGLLHDE